MKPHCHLYHFGLFSWAMAVFCGAQLTQAQVPVEATTNLPPLPPSMVSALTEPVAAIEIPDLFFAKGSNTLGAKDREILRDLGGRLKDLPVYFLIEAFADADGDHQTNLVLSEQRAAAVAQAMAGAGLNESQFVIRGFGDRFARGKTEGEKAHERKVTVTVLRNKTHPMTRLSILGSMRVRGLRFEERAKASPIPEHASGSETGPAEISPTGEETRLASFGLIFDRVVSQPDGVKTTGTVGVRGQIALALWQPLLASAAFSLSDLSGTFSGQTGNLGRTSFHIALGYAVWRRESFATTAQLGLGVNRYLFSAQDAPTGTPTGQGTVAQSTEQKNSSDFDGLHPAFWGTWEFLVKHPKIPFGGGLGVDVGRDQFFVTIGLTAFACYLF